MARILGGIFFQQPTVFIAQALLGKFLVRKTGTKTISRMITEVEAYDGPRDLASHASRGRRTARNLVMYGPAGYWYVYLVYGLHLMLNIVTGEKEYPAAILIRGVEGARGPGVVAKLYGIDRRLTGLRADKKTGFYIEDRGVVIPPRAIGRSARIGVAYAGPIWSAKKYRFYLKEFYKK